MKKIFLIGFAVAMAFGTYSIGAKWPPGCSQIGGQVVCSGGQSPY